MKKMLKKRLTSLVVLVLIVQASLMAPFIALKTEVRAQGELAEEAAAESPQTGSAENLFDEKSDGEIYVSEGSLSGEIVDRTISDSTTEVAAVLPELTGIADDKAESVNFSEVVASEEDGLEDYQTRGPPKDSFLAFSSDVHNQSDNLSAERLGQWLDIVQGMYGPIDYMGFCGDMADAGGRSNYWKYTQAVIDMVSSKGIPACYTTGNHEYDHGDSSSSYYYDLNNTTRQFTVDSIPSNLPEDANYIVYALGSMSSSQSYTEDQINHLHSFLTNTDADKPIIVLAHFPLHCATTSYGYKRETGNSDRVIDVLNTAADSGKTIIFLWGHNHTLANGSGEPNYDQIFIPGDSINYNSNSRKNIQFYYGAAGCMSDSTYSSGSAAVKGKGLVIQVRANGDIGFGYYNADGVDVTEAGIYPKIVFNTEPVPVEGITLDTTSMGIEVGKSASITPCVFPENADNRTVTWTSSNESIVTVSGAGLIKGIAEGEADIIATTNDGGYSAICHVTVNPSASPGIGYVITIGDYALSTQHSSDVLVNSRYYRYEGLTGIPYDETTVLSEDILWLIEPTAGGYYIMTQDGQYLNAIYTPTTRPTGCNAILKVDDTPDTWTLKGSLEDWVLSGSTLTSTNSGKSLTHEEGSSVQLNLFTIRSTGETSSMIDPDDPIEQRFIECTELSEGKDYYVTVTKDESEVYAIENVTGAESGDTGSVALEVISDNDPAYIEINNNGAVWNYTDNKYLTNNTRFLSRSSSSPYVPSTAENGRVITYSSSNKSLSISYGNSDGTSTYYLTANKGTFGLNTDADSAAQVRLFEKTTVYNFKYIVQFVNNGANCWSGKYALNEVPVYSGKTPKKAETDQFTYTFKGWSSDGGVTVYGSDEDLPAVTGRVVYVAQFEAHEKHQHIPGEIVRENEVAATCIAEGSYDEVVYCSICGEELSRETIIIPATMEHAWGEPVWTWSDDLTAATATFVCSNGTGHKETVVAEISKDEAAVGAIPYTATVVFNGESFTDTKSIDLTVNISLELKDGIILHTYVKNLPEGTQPSDYTISYNDVYGNLYTKTLISLTENKFSVDVDSPKMTQRVNIEIQYKGTTIYSNYGSVQRYCDKIIDQYETGNLVELCYAILHYGAKAQQFFSKYLNDLANANHPNLPFEVQNVPETLSRKTLDETKISKVTMSLRLQYRTEMCFYFTPASGAPAADISAEAWKGNVKVEGDEFESLVTADGKVLVIIKNLRAIDLNNNITVKLSIDGELCGEIVSSPISYLYLVRNISGMEDLSRALYNYYLKTVQFFE